MKRMRRAITGLTVVLFCTILSIIPADGTLIAHDNHATSVEDITLRDDAFHGRGELPFIEWWYFDAKLDNGYSLAIGVQVLNIFARGIATTRLTLYQQGSVIMKSYEKYFLRDFSASSDVPSVFIEGNQVILGTYDAVKDCFVYNVTLETPEGSVSLQFVGLTKGWKRQQQTGDWWAVVLPRANVTGTITLNDTTMNVTGSGYHDHNWGIGPRIALHFGWFWGTCSSSNYTVTWAEIRTTRVTQLPIMVVNTIDGGYLEIPSETIWFSTDNISLDHFKRVPWFFNIETITEHVFVVVDMEVISVDHIEMLGFINYWRYHVRCTGTIIVDGHMEKVDGISIMEYLRFR
jgi:predicted secreted hydrolase